MKDKTIVVLLKFYQKGLNPFDGAALECAILSGARVIALSMAPLSCYDSLKNITRLGAEGVLVSDESFRGSDTVATSLVLAESIKQINPDYVFCGRQSQDGCTAQVPPMIAERLKFSYINGVTEISGNKVDTRSEKDVCLKEKSVVVFEKIKTLRFPSMFSKVREIKIIGNDILNIPAKSCGISGSPTSVLCTYENSKNRRFCEFLSLDNIEAALKERLSERDDAADESGGLENGEKLDKVYYVGDIENIARKIAKKTERINVSFKTAEEIAAEIKVKKAGTVLWCDEGNLKTVGARVAVILGAGMCADCISFRTENGRTVMTRPALSGNIMADIICKGKTAFATVRTEKNHGSDIIFCVGLGGAKYMENIKKLAEKYNAGLCCSRAVCDSGLMPYSAQVGLTGRRISARIYVAFGISGAVQHTCAITGAKKIIAINSDRNARIFDCADFGIAADIKDLFG